MEAITITLQPLAWVLNPAGLVVASTLFFLVVSGIVGRIFPDIEVSASDRRTFHRNTALDSASQRARISK